MPPRRFSRFTFSKGIVGSDDRLFLTERIPFRFRQLGDTRQHIVKQGDTLHNIAARRFRPLPRPAGLFWVVADFQPDPIIDPTIALSPGRVLFVPSVRTVIEQIFSEGRRLET